MPSRPGPPLPSPGFLKLGGQSFDELLVQLREAHEQELQELRATLRTEAPAASHALPDRPASPAHARGVGLTKASTKGSTESSAWSAKSAVQFDPSLEQVIRQEMEEDFSEPWKKRGYNSDWSRGPRGSAADSGGASRPSNKSTRSGKSARIFESYEPRSIDIKEQCLKHYPGKTWQELHVQERARVIREALKPKHYMINPYSHIVRAWSAIHAFTMAYVGLVTPYEVVFLDLTWMSLFVANRLVDFIFLMDIILQFFLQVEIQRPHRGGSFIQRDPWTCRLMYLRSWFLVDVLLLFPFDVLAMTIGESSSLMRHAKVLRCLKLLRVARLVRMLRPGRAKSYWGDLLGLRLVTMKLIKFSIFLLLLIHWMACAWAWCGIALGATLCDHAAGMPIGSGGGSLLARDATWATTLYTGGKFSPDSPCDHGVVYVAALHWAVMTLTSIGYGDIVPIRFEEYIVCSVCMVTGGLLWAYVIGSICSILSNASPVDRNFEMKTDLLNVAMEEAELPLDERDKYRKFLKEAKAHDRRVSFGLMTESFSPMLRSQLLFHITKESIASVYYFNDPSAPPSILLDVASNLCPLFFSQLESLDHLRHRLCMIDRGTVAHCGRVLLHPNVFHEDFIVTKAKFMKVTRTVSLTYTQLLVLTRSAMDRMLAAHPRFKQTIRRCAVKTAFVQAVRITLAAYQKWKATMPAGARLSLDAAFDRALRDKTISMPGTFWQPRSEQNVRSSIHSCLDADHPDNPVNAI